MKKYHPIFLTPYTNWRELENEIYNLATAQEKGEVFEQFVYLFLQLNKDYYQISEIYRSKDIIYDLRQKLHLENTDYGVDGIFILNDGSSAAYQAKFRDSRGNPTIRELSTFWTEAERADYKYVIANATTLPPQADKHGSSILADKFDSLDKDFFDNLYLLANGEKQRAVQKATPHPFQERLIKNTLSGFEKHDRGKLIAACGAGKTLVSLWIVERLEAKTVLFLAPSLALIKQTLESWHKNKDKGFSYICICSDETVIDTDLDYGDYSVNEVDFPVTTDPEQIKKFLNQNTERKFIFSTYNSAHTLSTAMKEASSKALDLIIFDEAHRTAGQKNSEIYSLPLKNEKIDSKKRLFMTATERLVRPWVLERAAEADRIVFSMDDEKIYGVTFDRYSFGEAIKEGVISDYRIVLTAVTTSEVASLIRANQLIVSDGGQSEIIGSAENIFRQIVLGKAMQQFELKKTISFHSSVRRAKDFINGSSNESINLGDLFTLMWPESTQVQRYFDWVDGQMSARLRKSKLDQFEQTNIGVISNAKCLTEGVDVPIIDSVYFVDPKTSLIDIVQACGRALRKSKNAVEQEQFAYFIVPLVVSDDEKMAPDDGKFDTLLNVVQALRDQDERLADWIDQLNLLRVRGEEPTVGGKEDPLIFDLPYQLDLENFSQQVRLKVIDATSEPTVRNQSPEVRIRRSSFPRIVKPLGDMAYTTYMDNLVNPTLEKFKLANKNKLSTSAIRINHNNISHTQRLGLIKKIESDYVLTELGSKYLEGSVTDKEVFKQAMLGYNASNGKNPLYPYRAILEILISQGSLNFIEFLFGVYTLSDSTASSIKAAKLITSEIRKSYPDIERLSTANQEKVSKELNEKYGYSFKPNELWGSTTTHNKFIYFRNHLDVFDEISSTSSQIILKENSASDLQDTLDAINTGLADIVDEAVKENQSFIS